MSENIKSDIRQHRQGGEITSIRSKGTEDRAWRYNLTEDDQEENDYDGEVISSSEWNGTRSDFWSTWRETDDDDDEGRDEMMMMIKAGLTRREKEGVHLRKKKKEKKENDDDVGLTSITETATIKDSLFIEALQHQQNQHSILNQHQKHSPLNCYSPSTVTSQQPKVICYYCSEEEEKWKRKKREDKEREDENNGKDQQPVYPLTVGSLSGHGVSSGYHRCLSCCPSLTNTFYPSVNQLKPYSNQHQLCLQCSPSQLINHLNAPSDVKTFSFLEKCSSGQTTTPTAAAITTKRNCDHCVSPSNLSSSSSSSSSSYFNCCDFINCVVDQSKVNKLTDNSTAKSSFKCLSFPSPIGSHGSGSVLFSNLVANRRKLFTPQLLKSTIKSAYSSNNQSNYNSKLKQQPSITSKNIKLPPPSLSSSSITTTQKYSSSSALILSKVNSVKINNLIGKDQHPQSIGKCYRSFKMVADTDNHPINGEGMAMTIDHSNREMTMFMDNMNGHHYENINVYQHNNRHHPITNGKSGNYLSKDRPNSANSYSLESNSSGSNTTDSSSGNISSPLSGLNGTDDTHGDELQYGPGIVDKLRSKFLQYSLQTSSRTNGYHRSAVKRCSSLENLADRDSPSSSPLFHHSTCNGNNYGIRKGPNYVKYHQHNHLTSNCNNNNTANHNINHQHHYSSQSNHTKGNNHNGVDSGIDMNGSGGGGASAGIINNKGSINGKTSSSSLEKRLQGENRNSCSRTTNGFTSSSSSGRNYRKYEQQPIKSNHYHHLNQHSSIYHNHNHRYNCDGLLKRAQSVETLLLESRNSTKSTTSTSSTSTFSNCNNNNTSTTAITSTVGANCYNSNLNSTRQTSNNLNSNSTSNSISSPITSNSTSENCEPLPLSSSNNQQSRWQSTNNNHNINSVNSSPPSPMPHPPTNTNTTNTNTNTTSTTTTTTNNKVNSVSQVSNHLVTKQPDILDTVVTTTNTTTTSNKKMSSEDNNIVGVDGLPPSESKLKSSTSSIYSNSSLTSDKKMTGDITVATNTTTINNHNNNNNNSELINHGSRKLVEDELPKPDTVKNCKKIFETNSVSPTPLTGPLSPSSSSNQSATTTNDNNSSNPSHNNNSSLNESDFRNGSGGQQAYRKGGIYGSSNSAIRRKPPVLSSIEKKITVNKVTINNNHNTANNNNNNHNNSRLINGSSGTSSSPTTPALPPKPPFLITKKSPLNGELNHVNVNNNNYLSAIKPIGKQPQQLSPNESNKNRINSGKSSAINGSKDRLTVTTGSSNNLVKSKPLLPSSSSQSTVKPKLIKSDELSPSSSRSSPSSSSPLLSPSSTFIPPSPLMSNGSKKSVIGDDLTTTVKEEGEDTIDGCPIVRQLPTNKISTISEQFLPSIDNKETDKSLITKINADQKPTSTVSTTTTTSSMITNKPIANIKPIQLELNEDHTHRWKSTINKKSDSKSVEKCFPLGVTNIPSTNHNLITKDQSNNELNYLPSETKLTSSPTTTSESTNPNNEMNKINYSNNVNQHKSLANNKRIEVDEKLNSNPSMISKDNPIYGSRSYSSSSTTPSPPTQTTPPPTSSLTTAITAKSSPSSGTTMIFDFRGKNVKANVAVHSPPFSVVRPAASSSAGSRSDDNEDDYNYTGSTEIPKPSGIVFKGENIIIDGGSLLIKRNKKLTITFDDKATSTFEYPSETSFIEDSMTANFGSTSQQLTKSDESSSVIQQQSTTGSSLKNNTTLGGAFSGGLASYKPTFLASESVSFQLGVSRVIKGESDNNNIKSSTNDLIDHNGDESNQSADQDDNTSFNMIKPAEPSETTSWSTSSTALDLLF